MRVGRGSWAFGALFVVVPSAAWAADGAEASAPVEAAPPAPVEAPVDAPEEPAPEPMAGTLQGGSTHGLEDFRFRFYQSDQRLPDFPDEPVYDYQEFVERLQLTGGSSLLTLGLQGDAVMLASNEYILDDERSFERELWSAGLMGPHPNVWFGLEKLWLTGQSGGLSWTLGDSYEAFGRGLSLNMVRNTDIDVDTSLRGLHAAWSGGPWELHLVEAVANPQQMRMENPNVGMKPDLPHAVHGLRADWYGPVHVGAQGVAFQFARAYDPTGNPFVAWRGGLDAAVAGVTVEASSVGPFDLGAEFDYFAYDAPEIPVKSGYAGYVSASAYPGVAVVLLEGKLYKDTEWANTLTSSEGYEVVSGPSLEYDRAITEDSSAAVNSNDVAGGRARVDFALGQGSDTITPYVSVASFRDQDLGGVHFNAEPETIVHAMGGILLIRGEFHVLFNGGYRMDLRDDAPASNPGDSTAHGDLSVTIPLGHELSVELAPNVLHYHWGVNPVQQTDYTDFSSAVAFKIGTPYAIIVYTDYSDNSLIASTGNVSDAVYMAGELQWQPTSATTLKLFYGAYRAGIRCAGGQCRTLPGFEGARASFTANF